MRYKRGDIVKVRDDLIGGHTYDDLYCTTDMASYAGQLVTIRAFGGDHFYFVQEDPDNFYWNDAMFDPDEIQVMPTPAGVILTQSMSTEDVIRWLGEHYTDGAYTEAFGFECSIDKLIELKSSEEIIQCIQDYEAKHGN